MNGTRTLRTAATNGAIGHSIGCSNLQQILATSACQFGKTARMLRLKKTELVAGMGLCDLCASGAGAVPGCPLGLELRLRSRTGTAMDSLRCSK